MKMSEAFKLLESGEILTNGNIFLRYDTDGMLEYACTLSGAWNSWDLSLAGINFFSSYYKYEKPKEKVQMHIAIFRDDYPLPDGSIGHSAIPYVGRLFKDVEDFKDREPYLELIQLVKFGDPI